MNLKETNMKCKNCKITAVIQNPNYCKVHFIQYFENKVKKTIAEFKLLNRKEKIAVACSGGKDSLAVLYILNKLEYNVAALAVDEGISGYRDPSFEHLKKFCKKYKVKLKIYSFKKSFGKTLDKMHTENVGGMPCTTCGTLRRYLMNKQSEKFDKIVTGHNMDDEAQAVLMNLFKGQVYLMPRQGPITSEIKGFTQKVKPLYFMKEKEVGIYSFLMGFLDKFVECPNAYLAYRIFIRDLLNEYETEKPGTKENIVRKHIEYMKILKKNRGKINYCKECEEPSSQEVCKACQIKIVI